VNRRALCIVNPGAGKRTAQDGDLEKALDLLREAGFALDVRETAAERPSAADLATAAMDEGFDAVIVAGGDGTVQPVARALVGSELVLGILPFGTYMNVAHGLGLPLEPIAAAKEIARGRVVAMDVGAIAGKYFLETAGVGIDAELFGAARLAERRRWGQALRRLWRGMTQSSYVLDLVVDGTPHRHRAYQALVANSPYYLWGFHISPESRMDDGYLNVAVYARMPRRELVAALLGFLVAGSYARSPVSYRGRRIELSAEAPLPVHADGQIVAKTPATFECVRGALRVFAAAPSPT
jgi:YegS/Rv2252/BmrU family lipid kinase